MKNEGSMFSCNDIPAPVPFHALQAKEALKNNKKGGEVLRNT